MLTSAGIYIRKLGIRVSHHRSPRASLPSDSYHFTVFIMSFFFAESQFGIANELSHFFLFVYGWLALEPCCTVRLSNSLLYVLVLMLVSAKV